MRVRRRVLVVDDVAGDRRLIRRTLERELAGSCEIEEAPSGRVALAILADGKIDCVILDMRMPGMDGPAVIDAMRGRFDHVAIVAMTTLNDEPLIVQAMERGVRHCIFKNDLSGQVLSAAVDDAIETKRSEHGLRRQAH